MFTITSNSLARCFACLASACWFLGGTAALGQTVYDWDEPLGGSYGSISNWTPIGVPNDARESARFNLDATFDVTLGSGSTTTVSDLLVNNGDVTLAAGSLVFATYVTDDDVIISGGHLTLSQSGGNGDVRLTVGDVLNVNNGGTLTVELGSQLNANGNVNVDGGSITRTFGSGSIFNLAAGRTLTASNDAQIDLGGTTTLSGGTTWEIDDGADLLSVGRMNIGTSGGVTAVTVDGTGSTLEISSTLGDSRWGSDGHTAQVTVRNGASANIGDVGPGSDGIELANSATAGTTGLLSVESGTMTVGTLRVATEGGATTTGTITVTGSGSTLTQHAGPIALELGHASDGTATIDVLSGGTFNTGIGPTIIRATGSINIGVFGGGTFNANGNVNVEGGSITRAGGNFNLASGRTLTASNNAQIDLGANTSLSGGTTWNITDGADLFSTFGLSIGTGGGVTNVTVDGVGSSLTTGGSLTPTLTWGSDGHMAQVTVRNGASANAAATRIELANSATAGTTGILAVESGATMSTSGDLRVASNGGATTAGTITVTGAGSTLTQTGGSVLTLGHATSGSATLNVLDGGSFTDGTGGTVLHATGTINLDGGTFNVNGPITNFGGIFNWVTGAINVAGDLTTIVGATGLLGSNATLTASQVLTVAGTTTIDPFRILTLDGGSLSTPSLVVNGNFQFHAGTLAITGAAGTSIGAGGPLGSVVSLTAGQNLAVTNTLAVDSGATLVVGTGASVEAGTLANSGSIVLDGAAAILGGTAVSNSGLLRGEGVVSANVTNNAGGEIRAQAGKTLSLTGVNGPNAGRINLQGGTLDVAAALTNAAGGNIVGRGTLATGGLTNQGDVALSNGATDVFGDVVNDTSSAAVGITVSGNADATFWGDVTNTSGLLRVSAGSSATFFGGFSGNGISGAGDVYLEADITPGSSPGLQSFGGNVHFGELASLEIEIGGTGKGTQYDALQIAGAATLDGTLQIVLTDGFVPAPNDSFELIAASSIVGTFENVMVTTSSNDTSGTFDIAYTPAGLMITQFIPSTGLPGDYNGNGTVDAADYIVWRKTGGTPEGYATWRANFGRTTAVGAASRAALSSRLGEPTAVPEPATIALCLLALPLLVRRAKKTPAR